MAQRFAAPTGRGLRQPTDPQKSNGQIENPPRYLEHGGLNKASKTAVNVNGIGRPNVYAVVKPGKGSSR